MKNFRRLVGRDTSVPSTRLWLVASFALFFIARGGSAQQTAARPKADQPVKETHKKYGVYVPSTDLNHAPTDDKVQTTYWLAAEPSQELMAMASVDVDVSILTKIRTAYKIPEHSGIGAIAIVVAYHHPGAAADLEEFSRTFHLPQCGSGSCLEVLAPQTIQASARDYCDWPVEAATGLQWAHAIAPKAKLVLSEAETSRSVDMFAAVEKAGQRLYALGGGQVIIPWGSPEGEEEGEISSALEKQYDKAFPDGAVYFAASGDEYKLVAYPAASVKVVGVGGTIPNFGPAGELIGEAAWSHSGGGYSQFAAKPDFQIGVENTSQDHRSTPDLAITADFVPFYSTAPCSKTSNHWHFAEGTSVSVVLAGAMANAAGNQNPSTATELRNIYRNRNNRERIRDIVSGPQGTGVGYDTSTGVGAPASPSFDARPQPVISKSAASTRHK